MTSTDIHNDRILIIDFGGQTTQLIARRVRESGVYCEIHPWDLHAKSITTVEAHKGESEFGYALMDVSGDCALFNGLSDSEASDAQLDVWMSHGDRVAALPDGFELAGQSENAPMAAMVNASEKRFGIQFHPEVTHTKQGAEMLRRFVIDVCGCAGAWTPGNIIDNAVADAKRQVGDERVLLALSGGVDSSVVAALLHRAIGSQLTCVFVDHGLLRLNEGDQVMQLFADNMGVQVIRVNAQERFMSELAGVTDPEAKRKIIGKLFIEVFEEEAKKLKGTAWLAQGTIYPDVIESAASSTGSAHLIKSHHNVGGLPEHMELKLIEPLRELFKDEVRRIGVDLGLPAGMLYRHPFPGPGLGVRILGEVRADFADILRQADDIFIQALRDHDWYDKVSQAFAVFLPVKSVGVTGDGRRYDYVIALRAVETIDFMTARAAHLPHDFLDEVSRTICNSIPNVSRVTYDISSKPPATIEWE